MSTALFRLSIRKRARVIFQPSTTITYLNQEHSYQIHLPSVPLLLPLCMAEIYFMFTRHHENKPLQRVGARYYK